VTVPPEAVEIDALAFGSVRSAVRAVRTRVYPRGCGATIQHFQPAPGDVGLSPRMRGYPVPRRCRSFGCRSIPADAGLPTRGTPPAHTSRVYPRGCGATTPTRCGPARRRGLSPRMRGYRARLHGLGKGLGSIPADAGLPWTRRWPGPTSRVYPRGCGATEALRSLVATWGGLSPRMRGYLHRDRERGDRLGSIPADAGLPDYEVIQKALAEVYPRGCGATGRSDTARYAGRGLSPRMRGYLQTTSDRPGVLRSIPADAGLPATRATSTSATRVYPRGCGATPDRAIQAARNGGLSPRMRGYLRAIVHGHLHPRSIPADAGLPRGARPRAASERVYPRGCGATLNEALDNLKIEGLSPRMRGYRCKQPGRRAKRRSIPADAGLPTPDRWPAWTTWVYPRGCGATFKEPYFERRYNGLSPRMRGYLRAVHDHDTGRRSIPADAGLPY